MADIKHLVKLLVDLKLLNELQQHKFARSVGIGLKTIYSSEQQLDVQPILTDNTIDGQQLMKYFILFS